MSCGSADCVASSWLSSPFWGKERLRLSFLEYLDWVDWCLAFICMFPFSRCYILLPDKSLGCRQCFIWELQLPHNLPFIGPRFSTHLTHFPTTSGNEHFSHLGLSIAIAYCISCDVCIFVHIISSPSIFFLFSLYFPLHLLSLLGHLWTRLIFISPACLYSTVAILLNTNVSPVLKLQHNSCIFL